MNHAQMISKEENKCDPVKLEAVIEMIGERRTYKEIMETLHISLFDLSTYLEVAFYKSNEDPHNYIEQDKFEKIMQKFEAKSFPALKEIKNSFPECEYSDIRIVRGVYFRKKRFYQKNAAKMKEVVAETIDFEKVDLKTVPYILEAIETLKTDHWKKFALELFSKYAPKQFYTLPASLSGKHHNETEYAKGYFDKEDPKKLIKSGGKFYHSMRVYWQLNEILETDIPEIWDYNREKIVNYVHGNDFEPWQMDAMKVAALAHDIYSGGPEDETPPRKRSMDKHHAHYHKTLLKPIGENLPQNEWEAFVMMVDKHMWKWDVEPLDFSFHEGMKKKTVKEAYEFYVLYRMVKWVELSDYIASRKTDDFIPRLRQAFLTWAHLTKNLLITYEDFESMGIEKAKIEEAFPNASLKEIAEILLGEEKIKELTSPEIIQESFL